MTSAPGERSPLGRRHVLTPGGSQRRRGAGLVPQHPQPAEQPAQQVALLERGHHAHHGELGATVGQPHPRLGPGDHLDDPLLRADRHEHRLVRPLDAGVQPLRRLGRVRAELAQVDAEAQPAVAAGEGERLVEPGELDRGERQRRQVGLPVDLGGRDAPGRRHGRAGRQVLRAAGDDGVPVIALASKSMVLPGVCSPAATCASSLPARRPSAAAGRCAPSGFAVHHSGA